MATINVKLTPHDLYGLYQGAFSFEACQAIVEHISTYAGENDTFRLFDIYTSFTEVSEVFQDLIPVDEIIAKLNNGKILVTRYK